MALKFPRSKGCGVNRQVLRLYLRQSFPESSAEERRVVARLAGDLADSGRYREVKGTSLSPDTIIENLGDAPEGTSLPERWNWWVGALDLAHGGHAEFRVRER